MKEKPDLRKVVDLKIKWGWLWNTLTGVIDGKRLVLGRGSPAAIQQYAEFLDLSSDATRAAERELTSRISTTDRALQERIDNLLAKNKEKNGSAP